MHGRFRVATLMLALAGCGGAAPALVEPTPSPLRPTSAPATSQPASAPPVATPTSAPATAVPTTSAVIDLSGLDACALLDEGAVRAITGTSLEFVTDQRDNTHCFWGATTPGDPQYVEIDVFARPGGLAEYRFNPGDGCAVVPVVGVGVEAKGAICDNPQHKVHLLAWAGGVAVRVLVNEPEQPLSLDDLAATVNSVLDSLD